MSDVRETPPFPHAASDDAACGDARTTLDAWRAAGADRIDPLRFAAIDALARRIAKLSSEEEGEFRRLLDARLADADEGEFGVVTGLYGVDPVVVGSGVVGVGGLARSHHDWV